MKIFISWSGPHSLAVATALKEWLPFIFTDIQTFVSSDDVRKGKRWLVEIARELSTCNFGIVCLTPDNLESPWLFFEAGALSKLKASHVCTLLFGNLRPGNIEGPLSHFQATVFSKTDFFGCVAQFGGELVMKAA
jgi:TIR domain